MNLNNTNRALDRDAIFAQLFSEYSERIGDIRPDEAYGEVQQKHHIESII